VLEPPDQHTRDLAIGHRGDLHCAEGWGYEPDQGSIGHVRLWGHSVLAFLEPDRQQSADARPAGTRVDPAIQRRLLPGVVGLRLPTGRERLAADLRTSCLDDGLEPP
jgi:hypothetical protein